MLEQALAEIFQSNFLLLQIQEITGPQNLPFHALYKVLYDRKVVYLEFFLYLKLLLDFADYFSLDPGRLFLVESKVIFLVLVLIFYAFVKTGIVQSSKIASLKHEVFRISRESMLFVWTIFKFYLIYL